MEWAVARYAPSYFGSLSLTHGNSYSRNSPQWVVTVIQKVPMVYPLLFNTVYRDNTCISMNRIKQKNRNKLFVSWIHNSRLSNTHILSLMGRFCDSMGLLPDTQNCGCACAGNAENVFPVTAGKRSRHASRHVRHARAVMHAGIEN